MGVLWGEDDPGALWCVCVWGLVGAHEHEQGGDASQTTFNFKHSTFN